MKTCVFCSRTPSTYTLYQVILETDRKTYQIGLVALLEKLEDWIYKKMYHLSASQILLLRPDLVHEFFKDDKEGETIINWWFKEFFICKDCYRAYKAQVPTT
jgi:hypothetical protein